MDDLDSQVNEYLMQVAEQITNDVTDSMLKCLQDNIIDYAYQKENKVYLPSRGNQPSFQFYNAMQLEALNKTLRGYSKDLVYNALSMGMWDEPYTDENGKKYTVYAHTNNEGDDLREKLFDILDIRSEETYGTGFYDNFLNDVDDNLIDWIRISLYKNGIDGIVEGVDL